MQQVILVKKLGYKDTINNDTMQQDSINILQKEVAQLRLMVEKVYDRLGIDNEYLNAKEIAKELKISIKYLYNPRMRDELRGFGMSSHKRLRMKRCDLQKYMNQRGS